MYVTSLSDFPLTFSVTMAALANDVTSLSGVQPMNRDTDSGFTCFKTLPASYRG